MKKKVFLIFWIFVLGAIGGCSRNVAEKENAGQSKREQESEAKVSAKVPTPKKSESALVREKPASKTETSVPTQQWGNAPDFTLPKFKGGEFTLSSLKGKVIILDFWATWCGPCRMEIPGFVELYAKYKDKGLEIVGVALDRGGELAVGPFAKQYGMNYIIVFGDRKITQKYGGIPGIPTTFIIDRDGNVVGKHIGYAPKEAFEGVIKKLL